MQKKLGNSYTTILSKKDADKMSTYQLIFFMMLNGKKSYKNYNEISNELALTYGESYKRKQPAISKAMKILTGTVNFHGTEYTVLHTPSANGNSLIYIFTKKSSSKKHISSDDNEIIKLKPCLEKNKLCIIDHRIFVVKLNQNIGNRSKKSREEALNNRIKTVKKIISNNVCETVLLDIMVIENNIITILNSENERFNEYSSKCKTLFKLATTK